MQACIPEISVATYRPSSLHDGGRDWPETNCYTDVWIEILHARGSDPTAALGFTVAQDFEGDHFTFFKYPPEDLEALYGARVAELAIYDSVEAQVVEQVARGRLTLVEVDSFYLPDTQGAGYRQEHGKTTIAINSISPGLLSLDYFHGPGFYSLSGSDYQGALGLLPSQIDVHMPHPYAEFVKFAPNAPLTVSAGQAVRLLRRHLAQRPPNNPLVAFQQRLTEQAELVAMRPASFFHKYAFNTFRQVGANFELLASHLAWLAANGEADLDMAEAACRQISAEAKIMQFQLARAVARKKTDGLATRLEPLVEAYDVVIGELLRLYPDAG
jgi:hypothetical protein